MKQNKKSNSQTQQRDGSKTFDKVNSERKFIHSSGSAEKKMAKVKYKIDLTFESEGVISAGAMRVMCENLATYLATNKYVNDTEIHTDWFRVFKLWSKDGAELYADAKTEEKIMKIASKCNYKVDNLPENQVTNKSKNGGKNVR
jgi:hypothetical protein